MATHRGLLGNAVQRVEGVAGVNDHLGDVICFSKFSFVLS